MKLVIREWCQGRMVFWRAPILLWLISIAVGYLNIEEPPYNSFMGLNLAFHEMGHPLFRFLSGNSRFVGVLGGTLLQLLMPTIAALSLLYQPDYFGAIPFCGFWIATNLFGIAQYMADARARLLPLVTIGSGNLDPLAPHDWWYLLKTVGLLDSDVILANYLRMAAFVLMWGSIAIGIWMLAIMAGSKDISDRI